MLIGFCRRTELGGRSRAPAARRRPLATLYSPHRRSQGVSTTPHTSHCPHLSLSPSRVCVIRRTALVGRDDSATPLCRLCLRRWPWHVVNSKHSTLALPTVGAKLYARFVFLFCFTPKDHELNFLNFLKRAKNRWNSCTPPSLASPRPKVVLSWRCVCSSRRRSKRVVSGSSRWRTSLLRAPFLCTKSWPKPKSKHRQLH